MRDGDLPAHDLETKTGPQLLVVLSHDPASAALVGRGSLIGHGGCGEVGVGKHGQTVESEGDASA